MRTKKTVVTRSLKIGYREWGAPSGAPVILLHGLPDDARALNQVARAAEGDRGRLRLGQQALVSGRRCRLAA